MNRLGRFRSKISDRGSDTPPTSAPLRPEPRSGPFCLRRCACGRLSWDEYTDHCLFGHKAHGEHRKLGRHEVAV